MYYLLFAVCYLISLLPFPVLYVLSDVFYGCVYYIIGYRKNLVRQHLAQAFPESGSVELRKMEKAFYHDLCDMVVETIKMMTISPQTLQRRFQCDLSLLHRLAAEGKSCQIQLGHRFNWEWANLYFKLGTSVPFLVVYMPISNLHVERLMNYIRRRFGTVLIPADRVLEAMKPWQSQPHITILVADQNPSSARRCYWENFLNRPTAFYKGPELIARRFGEVVIFGDIQKIRRGYYHAIIREVFPEPAHTAEGQISHAFSQFLEQKIHEQPHNWLWSHRRWKHQPPPGWAGTEKKFN
ncbi:KDO2-lipid IV(A) lauroyltransferase [Thermoflavifilum aggregans]|uniref:KDO2-lipid IV(A) lauroyltransferase n=1 Tax=Thermoflavifilum aggregans TaxID=454188 RepID=A0A2M9CS23_9BACT|nr:lysophospholipid acyltransferase family protein [Thermoflavifilum aggregans]PJJ74635.1 KDO2-lipid IV(A) lauroyltransferase [Thermoflavifilum aggregans]